MSLRLSNKLSYFDKTENMFAVEQVTHASSLSSGPTVVNQPPPEIKTLLSLLINHELFRK